MKHWKRTLVGLALGVAAAGTAHAKTFYTAPANATFAAEQLYCEYVNAGTSAVQMAIEVRGYGGEIKESVPPFTRARRVPTTDPARARPRRSAAPRRGRRGRAGPRPSSS
jgi:hypothetical protein